MLVEVWSDVVCPWCYIGKRHLEQALDGYEHRDDVVVRWRSFELDPSAPATREGDYVGRLAAKYGVAREQAQEMVDGMTARGAGVGLDLRFDRSRPGNTFDAHRLLHLAAERGVQDALEERLFAATFTDGEPIAEHDALVRLATEVGLDADEARVVLESDAYADAVRADERQASAYGIRGVPFFVVDGTYAASGAQPPEVLLEMLDQARQGVA
jgi:predicted DsbA family dithiol-disulfide isomerase